MQVLLQLNVYVRGDVALYASLGTEPGEGEGVSDPWARLVTQFGSPGALSGRSIAIIGTGEFDDDDESDGAVRVRPRADARRHRDAGHRTRRSGRVSESRPQLGQVTVRPRRPADVPGLVDVLREQQPTSRYPFRDPLPIPVERFFHTDDAVGAWTAELDGRPVGHVCHTGPPDGFPDAAEMNRTCALAHGCDVERARVDLHVVRSPGAARTRGRAPAAEHSGRRHPHAPGCIPAWKCCRSTPPPWRSTPPRDGAT